MPPRKKGEPLHLIDTNVILRFLIGDDPPKAARAAALMERVEKSESIIEVSEAVVAEVIWTLQSFYKVPRTETAAKLSGLLTLAGVRCPERDILLESLQIYSATSVDFVDCLLAARSKVKGIPIYTFDETDFKKLGSDWEKP